MSRLSFSFELPLLARELVEQAARRRTYVVRFAYALLLFSITCGLLYGIVYADGVSSRWYLGQGRVIFERLVTLQFWGICLFLPGMASGLIAGEKERDTLGLLLVTTLGPWQIVLQKLASRLVPILTFLFLSFPLMAVAYSYGGVNQSTLWCGIILLVLTAIQIGALATMCSSFCRTTAEAMIACYILFFVLYNVIPIAFAPMLFQGSGYWGIRGTLLWSIPNILSTLIFVTLARVYLVRRAAVLPKNVLLQFFRRLDVMYMRANRVTGGIMLTRDIDVLPGDRPVAWRETNKKSLGTVRYLFRVCVVLEFPLLFAMEIVRGTAGVGLRSITALLFALWCIAVALIVVHAGSLIPTERSRQTLDVLLTTPLDGRRILLEKFYGVRRLIIVLILPFVSVFAFEWWWGRNDRTAYMFWSVLSVLVYLPLTAWLTLLLSLYLDSQMRTILATFGLLAAWVVGPELVRWLLHDTFGFSFPDVAGYLHVVNPAIALLAIESGSSESLGIPDPPATYCLVNFVIYGGLLMLVRNICLRDADKYLGRITDAGHTAEAE